MLVFRDYHANEAVVILNDIVATRLSIDGMGHSQR